VVYVSWDGKEDIDRMTQQGKAFTMLNVLVVDDEANIRKMMAVYLKAKGHKVVAVGNFRDAVNEGARRSFDVAFVDLRLGTADGLDLIPELLALMPWLKIVVITAYSSVETAVEAMQRGAADYLPKPFTPAQINLMIQKVTALRSLEHKVLSLQDELGRTIPPLDFASQSPAMQRAVNLAREVAGSASNVLLRGESGTGKSTLAKAIHNWSDRAEKPFGIISCPSLSADLLESELFGHAKGAFTGAIRDYPGRIAACEGGTLFLDEIGDLPLSIQPKLLRFVQDREFERIGDHLTRKADVRIISATSLDLESAMPEGRFRQDLYYRLNVLQIDIPPLRERHGDIRALAEEFLAFFGGKAHRFYQGFTEEAVQFLMEYGWPGNVRELSNAIERAAIVCKSPLVGIEHLPDTIRAKTGAVRVGDLVSLSRIEEEHIRRVLGETDSLQEAAEILGIDQATLWRRRKQYNI